MILNRLIIPITYHLQLLILGVLGFSTCLLSLRDLSLFSFLISQICYAAFVSLDMGITFISGFIFVFDSLNSLKSWRLPFAKVSSFYPLQLVSLKTFSFFLNKTAFVCYTLLILYSFFGRFNRFASIGRTSPYHS